MRVAAAGMLLLLAACGRPTEPGFDRISDDQQKEGHRLAIVLGCTGCHGDDLAGRDWSDDLGGLWTANLTRAGGTRSAASLKTMITEGREPGGRDLWDMPSHLFTQLTPSELDALVAYVQSVPPAGQAHPAPIPGPNLRALAEKGVYFSSAEHVRREGAIQSPDAGPAHARARHMVRATCAECHHVDLKGGTDPIAGKTVPNLVEMAAAYSPQEFDRLMTKGIASGGREVGLMSEVARGRFSHLTAGERAAILAYLHALADKKPG